MCTGERDWPRGTWVSFLERSNKHVIGFFGNGQAAGKPVSPHATLFRAAEPGSPGVEMSQVHSGSAGGSRLSQMMAMSWMTFGSQEADKDKTVVGCSHQQHTSPPQGAEEVAPEGQS